MRIVDIWFYFLNNVRDNFIYKLWKLIENMLCIISYREIGSFMSLLLVFKET
jgi:hypothetical protein